MAGAAARPYGLPVAANSERADGSRNSDYLSAPQRRALAFTALDGDIDGPLVLKLENILDLRAVNQALEPFQILRTGAKYSLSQREVSVAAKSYAVQPLALVMAPSVFDYLNKNVGYANYSRL